MKLNKFGYTLMVFGLALPFLFAACASKMKLDKVKTDEMESIYRTGNSVKVLSAIQKYKAHGITKEQLKAFSEEFDAVDYSHSELIRFCEESMSVPTLHQFFADALYGYEEREVFADMNKNRIDSLMMDYNKCVYLKDAIKDFFKSIDCDDYTYNQLDYYYHYSNSNDLTAIFDSLLKAKKSDIYDEISEMSIKELAEYYKENDTNVSFLKNTIEESALGNLEEEDFRFISQVHNCFKNTDLSQIIEPIYSSRREDLLQFVTNSLEDALQSEKDMIQYLCETAKNDVAKYIEEKADVIIEKCEERIDYGFIKEGKEKGFINAAVDYENDMLYEYTDFVNKTVSKEISETIINALVDTRILSFISFSQETRKDLIENLFFESVLYPVADITELQNISSKQVKINGNSIDEIEHIKNENSKIDKIFNRADFYMSSLEVNPYVAGAIGAAGFVVGIINARKEAKQTQKCLSEFKYKMISALQKYYDKMIDVEFSQLESANSISQEQFKNVIYENF